MTDTQRVQIPGEPETWVREEVERLGRIYELDELYAKAPVQLRRSS